MTRCTPCRQFDGDNGGETGAKGVTRDAIKIAYYYPTANPATQAALRAAGAGDEEADVDRAMEVAARRRPLEVTWFARTRRPRRAELEQPVAALEAALGITVTEVTLSREAV